MKKTIRRQEAAENWEKPCTGKYYDAVIFGNESGRLLFSFERLQ